MPSCWLATVYQIASIGPDASYTTSREEKKKTLILYQRPVKSRPDGRRARNFPLQPAFLPPVAGQLCVPCLAGHVVHCSPSIPFYVRVREQVLGRTLGAVDVHVHQRMLPASRALVRLTCVESASRGFSSQPRSRLCARPRLRSARLV